MASSSCVSLGLFIHVKLSGCSEGVKAPLAIGDVLLDDGSEVKGFVGESYAVQGMQDITSYGSWRRYKQP